MNEGDQIRQNRLRCIRSAGQMPSPALTRDIGYENAVNNRIAIELVYDREMRIAELQYRVKIIKIFTSTFVVLVLGVGGLIVKYALG